MRQQVCPALHADLDVSKLSAIHPELRVKTVKYFKSIERVQDEVDRNQAKLTIQDQVSELE
jgi:hypothetical protein